MGQNKIFADFSVGQALGAEIVLTFLLVITIFGTAVQRGSRIVHYHAWPIGASLGVGVFFGGPITNFSVNPARAFGPALVRNKFDSDHWIFWVGPFAGAILAALVGRFIF